MIPNWFDATCFTVIYLHFRLSCFELPFLKMVSSCQGEKWSFFLLFDHCWFHFPFPFPCNSEQARIDPDGREITIGTFFNDKVVSKHPSLLLCNSLRIIYEESRFENGHCSIYVACLQRVVENMFTIPRCHTLLWLRPNNSHFTLTPERVAASFWKQNFWKE